MARPDDDDPYWDQPGDEQDYRRVAYAGFWTRFVAAFLDGLLTQAIGFGIGMVLGILMVVAKLPEGAVTIFSYVVGVILGWLYGALMESSANQATLGKMALGIKVTDMNGRRITFGHATGRHFAKYVSALPLLIGFIMAAFTEKKQALHDMIAGTLVVRR